MQDRVPPQNIEAEQSVLGAMLIERSYPQGHGDPAGY